MLTQTAASKTDLSSALRVAQPDRLTSWKPGLWRLELPHGSRVIAGTTDRTADVHTLQASLTHARGLIFAEQIHGSSVAAIESEAPPINPIPGCDGLITRIPGLALVIRTADCLPLVVWDPTQQVVGLAHVGWRGLLTHLPMRMVSGLRHSYRSRPDTLWVGIGPAIRDCCYEVGHEFEERFGPFVRASGGRLTCDLVGCAVQQLVTAGVPPSHLLDCGQCTACEGSPACPDERGAGRRWHSVRRGAAASERLLSFVMISHPRSAQRAEPSPPAKRQAGG